MIRRFLMLVVAGVALAPGRASAIDIVLDYTLDEQNWNWFSGTAAGLERRAALDAAAGFLSAILTDDDWDAVAIDSTAIGLYDLFQSSINGFDGLPVSGTAESDGAGYSYNLPISNRSTVGANEFVVYVTAFAFDNRSTAHAKASANGAARRNAAGAAGAEFSTWGGDVLFDLSDTWYAGQNPGIDPTDDYGVQDPDKTPASDITTDNWDFSTSSFTWKGYDLEKTDPAADGRLDLYATALHELVHTLGMTTANVPIYIGTNAQGELIGENVTAVYGGPVPASGGHVAQNVESVVWGSDGIVSEALLDPNSLRGVRKYLTELDAALLRDLGYTVATGFATPLPGDYNDDGLVDAADYTVWRDGGSPDDSVEGYNVWAGNYGATAPASRASAEGSAVPEPGAIVLLGSLLTLTALERRGR
ncbi:hypothetical protein [Botrimarina mediterranea]|uniref:PEP-CTERM protein-sorting domain-containing protein n=1 Tax=Botrimarina mediterranea TaxID=2528022 RepID=A0A518KCA3_9BACT|nr:hypothetical protein [Botrimarina mediterranea]QDV75426.1 hypothetical protein Spa11_36430 [Botrimarina mediterranea]